MFGKNISLFNVLTNPNEILNNVMNDASNNEDIRGAVISGLEIVPATAPVMRTINLAFTLGKLILFIIILILSIVSLAGTSKSKSTGKGKLVLALSVIIFLMTLGLLFRSKLESNTNVVIYLIVYLVLALVSTIIERKNIDTLEDEEERKQATNSSRSTTGIVVLVGLYLFYGFLSFYVLGDVSIRALHKQLYFL